MGDVGQETVALGGQLKGCIFSGSLVDILFVKAITTTFEKQGTKRAIRIDETVRTKDLPHTP
jgi:hypothetical protein